MIKNQYFKKSIKLIELALLVFCSSSCDDDSLLPKDYTNIEFTTLKNVINNRFTNKTPYKANVNYSDGIEEYIFFCNQWQPILLNENIYSQKLNDLSKIDLLETEYNTFQERLNAWNQYILDEENRYSFYLEEYNSDYQEHVSEVDGRNHQKDLNYQQECNEIDLRNNEKICIWQEECIRIQNDNEEKRLQYESDVEEYYSLLNEYNENLRIYNEALSQYDVAYNKYLIYLSDLEKYHNYLALYDSYLIHLNEYNEYLVKLELYEQYILDLEKYNNDKEQYELENEGEYPEEPPLEVIEPEEVAEPVKPEEVLMPDIVDEPDFSLVEELNPGQFNEIVPSEPIYEELPTLTLEPYPFHEEYECYDEYSPNILELPENKNVFDLVIGETDDFYFFYLDCAYFDMENNDYETKKTMMIKFDKNGYLKSIYFLENSELIYDFEVNYLW